MSEPVAEYPSAKTVEQVRRVRAWLELEIVRLIHDFEDGAGGAVVERIRVLRADAGTVGKPSESVLVGVEIEVRL